MQSLFFPSYNFVAFSSSLYFACSNALFKITFFPVQYWMYICVKLKILFDTAHLNTFLHPYNVKVFQGGKKNNPSS